MKLHLFAILLVTCCSVLSAQPTPYPAKDGDWPGQGVIRKFGWMDDNRAHFWTQREKDQGKIVFAGDSLTAGWKSLATAFPDLKVANRGIGGDVSRGLLFRFQEDVLDLKPQAIVILIGSNDLTAHGQASDTLANVSAMLDQAQKLDAKLPVILCTLPLAQNPKAPMKEPQRQAINDGIRQIADERANVELCDLDKALLTDGKFDPANFGPDKLHLGPAGYERWSAALKPIFEKLNVRSE